MLFSNKDALRVGEILARVAQAEIMPRFRTLNADQVRQKSSSFDLVTEADEAVSAAAGAVALATASVERHL